MKYRKYEVRLFDGEMYIALEDLKTSPKKTLLYNLYKAKSDQVIKMQILVYGNPRRFEPIDLYWDDSQKRAKEYKGEKNGLVVETIYIMKKNIYLIADRGVTEADELNGNTNK